MQSLPAGRRLPVTLRLLRAAVIDPHTSVHHRAPQVGQSEAAAGFWESADESTSFQSPSCCFLHVFIYFRLISALHQFLCQTNLQRPEVCVCVCVCVCLWLLIHHSQRVVAFVKSCLCIINAVVWKNCFNQPESPKQRSYFCFLVFI